MTIARIRNGRRWIQSSARALTAAVCIASVAAWAGEGPNRPASATFPPLYVDCRGASGSGPTVILEAGAFGTSADWDFVLDDLAKGGRVCAFDRAGLGRSPPRPGEKDVLTKAGEINNLLDQLGETRPVILVGHSNGALYVQAFASLWPDRVAGLVYVNGVGPDAADDPLLVKDLIAERRAANLAVLAGRLGLAGVVADTLAGPMSLRAGADARKRTGLASLERLKTARDEDRAILPGLETVRRLGDAARTLPTVAIAAAGDPDDPVDRAWRKAQAAPATGAARAWLLDMPGATHVSPLTRDRAYVTAAVDWLRSLSPSADIGH